MYKLIPNIEPIKFTSFLVKTQNTILSAAFVIAVSTAINAGLGFVKGRLLVHYFGVSNDLTVFYTADRIPSLIYSVMVVGALSTVFIPVFTELLKKDKAEAFKTASSIINVVLLVFIAISTLIFIFSPQILEVLAVGRFSPEEIRIGTDLMRIMVASQILLVVGSLLTSVLQSFKYFLVPALAPVAYNMGMILGTVLLSNKMGIYGPTFGVLAGALLHMLIQVPLLKKTGFSFSLSLNLNNKGLREMLGLVPPRLLSVFLTNAVGTINNSLAILVSSPSVIFLKFATQLQTFPVTLFGLSIAAASLPTLSLEGDESDLNKFKKTFLTSLHQTLFLVVPLSVILVILRVPVVRIVYGSINFPWEATIKTSYVLAFFSLSIFSQSINYLITRAFYALKDTKTPLLVSLGTIALNVAISLFFVLYFKLGVWAVALSFTITSIIDTIMFLYLLNKKVAGFGIRNLMRPFVKISYAGLFMGATLYAPLKLLDIVVIDTSKTLNLFLLCGIVGICGLATYLVFTKLFRVEEVELLYKVLRRLNLQKREVSIESTQNTSI